LAVTETSVARTVSAPYWLPVTVAVSPLDRLLTEAELELAPRTRYCVVIPEASGETSTVTVTVEVVDVNVKPVELRLPIVPL